jgi:hypothetical protein
LTISRISAGFRISTCAASAANRFCVSGRLSIAAIVVFSLLRTGAGVPAAVDHALAEGLGQLEPDDAADHVGAAAGRERHHEAYGTGGVVGSVSGRQQAAENGNDDCGYTRRSHEVHSSNEQSIDAMVAMEKRRTQWNRTDWSCSFAAIVVPSRPSRSSCSLYPRTCLLKKSTVRCHASFAAASS